MSDKDEIKELFQKELGNYEAKVDPSLWNGIQSGLSGAAATSGTATGMSIATKAVIGVVIGAVATVSSIAIFFNEETKSPNQATVEKTQINEEAKENKSEVLETQETNNITDNVIVKEEIETEVEIPPVVKIESKNSEKEKQNQSSIETKETTKTSLITPVKEDDKQLKETETSTKHTLEEEKKKEKDIEKPLLAEINIDKQDNQYVEFNLTGENIQRVEWYFGDGKSSNEMSPEHFYEEPGDFEVVAIIHGENDKIVEKKINVQVNIEGKFTNLPNIFSPNNDMSNDVFFVEHEGIKELQLTIFNQRQERVFSTNDPNFQWKGFNSKGERVPEGEYVYVIIAKDNAGNVINKYKTLTIIR